MKKKAKDLIFKCNRRNALYQNKEGERVGGGGKKREKRKKKPRKNRKIIYFDFLFAVLNLALNYSGT